MYKRDYTFRMNARVTGSFNIQSKFKLILKDYVSIYKRILPLKI